MLLTMWALVVTPLASVVGEYTRLWLGGDPLRDQPASVLAPSIVQLIAVPEGRLSVKDSPVATAVPEFLSMTVKPICEPAVTLAASAVLKTETAGAGGGGGIGVHPGNLKLPMRVRQLNGLLSVVLVRVPEGAVVHRVNAHGAVIAPAVAGAGLAAGAGKESRLPLGQCVDRVGREPPGITDLREDGRGRGAETHREVATVVHRGAAHPAPRRVRLIGALLEDGHGAVGQAAQLEPPHARDAPGADRVVVTRASWSPKLRYAARCMSRSPMPSRKFPDTCPDCGTQLRVPGIAA